MLLRSVFFPSFTLTAGVQLTLGVASETLKQTKENSSFKPKVSEKVTQRCYV